MLYTYSKLFIIMKSLKEFITENLENTPIITVEENQEQPNENKTEEAVAENAEAKNTED